MADSGVHKEDDMNRFLNSICGRKLRPVIDAATPREEYEYAAWQARRDQILGVTGFIRHLTVDLGIVILIAIFIRYAAQRYGGWF